MDKPISLVINEFKNNIQKAVTDSQLNPVILEMIFKDIYLNIKEVSIQYENQEMQQYQESLKNNEEDENV